MLQKVNLHSTITLDGGPPGFGKEMVTSELKISSSREKNGVEKV
jgi:hypothetical protein